MKTSGRTTARGRRRRGGGGGRTRQPPDGRRFGRRGGGRCGGRDAPEGRGRHLGGSSTGDRVLWIIIAVLAVISILVVYSSTAKMAYDAHTARTTYHFLRQQVMVLILSSGR